MPSNEKVVPHAGVLDIHLIGDSWHNRLLEAFPILRVPISEESRIRRRDMLCQIKPVTQNYDLRIRQLRPFLWSSKQAYISLSSCAGMAVSNRLICVSCSYLSMLVEKRWIVLIMLELIHGVVHYVDSIHECGSVILRRHIQLYISTCYSFFLLHYFEV